MNLTWSISVEKKKTLLLYSVILCTLLYTPSIYFRWYLSTDILFPGSSDDTVSANQERRVWPPLPRGVIWPLRGHLSLCYCQREDVQGASRQNGRQDQVLEEALVRLRSDEENLLLLHRWGKEKHLGVSHSPPHGKNCCVCHLFWLLSVLMDFFFFHRQPDRFNVSNI